MSENVRQYSQGQPVIVTDRNFRGCFRVGVVVSYSSRHDEYRITFSEDSTRWYRNDVITGAISLPSGTTVLHTKYGFGRIVSHAISGGNVHYNIEFNGKLIVLPKKTLFDSVSILTAVASNARLEVGNTVAVTETLEVGTITHISPRDSNKDYAVIFDSPSATCMSKYYHPKDLLLIKHAKATDTSEFDENALTDAAWTVKKSDDVVKNDVETSFAERILAEMVTEEARILTEMRKLELQLGSLRGAKEKMVESLKYI